MTKVEIPIKETFVELWVTVEFPEDILNVLAITSPDKNPTKWFADELEELTKEFNHRLYELKMPKTKVSVHNDAGKWAKRR